MASQEPACSPVEELPASSPAPAEAPSATPEPPPSRTTSTHTLSSGVILDTQLLNNNIANGALSSKTLTPAKALRSPDGTGQTGRLGLSREAWQMVACGSAEFFGTGILCFLGCMGTMPGPIGPAPLSHFQIAITFGFVVAVCIATFGHVSGAHINPAVTLATVIAGILPIKMAIVYFVTQCLGAILGVGLLKLITPAELFGNNTCVTCPHKELNAFQAVSAEFLATSVLIMLCCAIWDPRNSKNTDGIALKFGILVASMALAEGPYTGASMNPARSLGPAVWNNSWTSHWVYWVGPLLAAAVVTYTWRVLFLEVPEAATPEDQDADVPLTTVSSSNEKRNSDGVR